MTRLTSEEHSTLLYLMDALLRAPGKANRLLELAEQAVATDAYRKALVRLADAVKVRNLVKEIKRLQTDIL